MMNMLKKLLTIIIIFVPCMYFGINHQVGEMGIVLTASLICSVFLNLNELKNSVSVIKSKNMEIKFKDMMNKAYVTMEHLNKTQYSLTKVATETLYRSKFWGGCCFETTLDIINGLYKDALKNESKNIINGPIKLAYERLISEAFKNISNGIVNNNDNKTISEILNNIYVFKADSNIVSDTRKAPSVIYIKNKLLSLQIDKETKDTITKNLLEYENLINIYQNIYGKIITTDCIN